MIDSKGDDHEPVFETIDDLANRARSLLARLEEKDAELSTHMESVRSSAEDASAMVEQIGQLKQSALELSSGIEQLKSSMDEDRSTVADLSEHCTRLVAEIEERKEELGRLSEEASELRTRIELLLPGATSAGLASAFRERKEDFRKPRRVWGAIFMVAVLSLVAVAYINPATFEIEAPDYQLLIPYFLERLPFVIPVIWLAIYAAIRHRQALQLEEEYAYKEALSKSFEGYKTQLLEIDADAAEKKHTLDLIHRTLNALALHPGRVYQGRRADRSAPGSNTDTSTGKRRNEDGTRS